VYGAVSWQLFRVKYIDALTSSFYSAILGVGFSPEIPAAVRLLKCNLLHG
jgi:hypothetical protein